MRARRSVRAALLLPAVLLVATFSGGGTRAPSFSYGVLQELAATWSR